MVMTNLVNHKQETMKIAGKLAKIDAAGLYYRDLNSILRNLDNNGIEKIEIRNIENCTLCRDCVKACPESPKAVELAWDETSFIFGVESTGAISSERILQEALNILDEKLTEFLKQFPVKKHEKSKD